MTAIEMTLDSIASHAVSVISGIKLDGLLELVKASTPIVAIIIYILGYKAYRTQKMWDRKVEVANQALGLMYDSKRVIRDFRRNFSWAAEGAPQNEEEDALVERFKPKDVHKFLVESRKRKHLFENLITPANAMIPRLMSSFGPGSEAPIIALLTLVKDIDMAKMEISNKEPLSMNEAERKQQVIEQRFNQDISSGRDDEIEEFIDSLCKTASEKMKGYIQFDKFQYPEYYNNYHLIGHYKQGEKPFWPIRELEKPKEIKQAR